jgi:hypothetical protein
VAQYYNIVGGPESLRKELHSIFNYDYPLTSLHTFLADISEPLLIVTTNYDDLIEGAFDAKPRKYDLVIHATNPDLGDQLLWWKHGAPEPEPGKVSPHKLDIDLKTVTVIYKRNSVRPHPNDGCLNSHLEYWNLQSAWRHRPVFSNTHVVEHRMSTISELGG